MIAQVSAGYGTYKWGDTKSGQKVIQRKEENVFKHVEDRGVLYSSILVTIECLVNLILFGSELSNPAGKITGQSWFPSPKRWA